MPYSPSHQYIHIRIPKTGSTSISHCLRSYHLKNGGEYIFRHEKVDSKFRSKYNLDAIDDPKPRLAQHLSALQFKYILGSNIFNRCFKVLFCSKSMGTVSINV